MMKRICALILTVALCLPMLAGCHGAKRMNAFEIPEEFDISKQHTITFWAKSDTNVKQTNIYKKAIEDFEALYPNIHVELKIYTDYSRIYNDVITNIPTQTTPNICITYPDHIATYITGDNTVVPLDGLFANEKYGLGGSELRFEGPTYQELIPKFLEECAIGDEHYAMPYMRSTEACYVNKTYVEALGYTLPEVLTWDFVFEVSEAAMAQDAEGNFLVNGQNVMIPFIYKSTDNMMIQMLHQLDAGYSTAEGDILIFNDATEDILRQIAPHADSRAFSTFKISSYPANFLNKGQCIFAIDSTAGATWMGTHAPLSDIGEDSLVEFETVVMPVPQYDTENPTMISQGPSVCVFNKSDPQEVLASWLFAQYLLTDEVQIAYSQTEGYAPVTTIAQENEAYLDYLSRAGEDNDMYYYVKLDATRLLLENTDRTFVTPVFNGSASLRNAAGHLIESVAKSMRRKETVDDAYFEKLYGDTVTLYKLDQKSITERADLGELPAMSKALIGVLGGTWALIVLYVVAEKVKKRKK